LSPALPHRSGRLGRARHARSGQAAGGAACALLLLLLSSQGLAQTPQADPAAPGTLRPAGVDPDDPRFLYDEHGRRLRVVFDPGSQARLGLELADEESEGQRRLVRRLTLGLGLRSLVAWEQDEESGYWQIDHRLLWGWLRAERRANQGGVAAQVVLYDGSFLRHDESPYLVLPGSPPRRVVFPFDLGFELRLGRLSWLPAGDATPDVPREQSLLRLGVVRPGLVLDPWRSGRAGNSLELSLQMRYEIDVVAPESDSRRVLHRVAPFSAGCLRWRLQDAAGRTGLDLRAELARDLGSDREWRWDARGALRLERVVLAVDDEPVALSLELGAEAPSPQAEEPRARETWLVLGLHFGWTLD